MLEWTERDERTERNWAEQGTERGVVIAGLASPSHCDMDASPLHSGMGIMLTKIERETRLSSLHSWFSLK
jgi:hypothetical protein